MRGLKNDRQRLFVTALMELGDFLDVDRAAMLAGYTAASKEALHAQAQRLAHDATIQAAMLEESRRRLVLGAIVASSAVVKIVGNSEASDRDRLRAAEMIFNRVGMPAETKSSVEITNIDASDKERVQRVIEMARQLGLDPKQLLGQRGIVVDAEFTEVKK